MNGKLFGALALAGATMFLVAAGAFNPRPVNAAPSAKNGYVTSYRGKDSRVDVYCHEGTLIVVTPPEGGALSSGVGGASVALAPGSQACQ